MTDRLAHGLRSLGVAIEGHGRHLPADGDRDRGRGDGVLEARRDLGADLQRVRPRRRRRAARRRRREACSSPPTASLRKGSAVPMNEIAAAAADAAGCVERVVTWRRLGAGAATGRGRARDVRWDELLAAQPEPLRDRARSTASIRCSSATRAARPAGRRASLHVHGGFLVKIAEEVAYQVDLHPGEILHWVTDLGWIMGPWEIVGALALGATVLLTEGAPTHPGPGRLWEMVERHGVTTLGVSPTLIRALIPSGTEPVHEHDLSSLRILASHRRAVEPGPVPVALSRGRRRPSADHQPVGRHRGRRVLPLAASDHAAEVRHAAGTGARHGRRRVGARRRTRCRAARSGSSSAGSRGPSMTRGIWGDEERYLETYWSRWPGVWVHGDWASIDEDGYWFLHGRSDDTLNVAGKRLGPAEVESVLASHPAVAESAAIGVPHEVKGETIWCVVVARPDAEAGGDLATELRRLVADHLGRSFMPGRVVFAPELPKTRSAKIVRRAIRAVGDRRGPRRPVERGEPRVARRDPGRARRAVGLGAAAPGPRRAGCSGRSLPLGRGAHPPAHHDGRSDHDQRDQRDAADVHRRGRGGGRAEVAGQLLARGRGRSHRRRAAGSHRSR